MVNYMSKTFERGRWQITAKFGVFHGFSTAYDERVLHLFALVPGASLISC